MSELKEYVDFYTKNGFWIYPFQGSADVFDESYWSKLTYQEYLKELNKYDWDSSKGINVVTGKNDICILKIESHPNNGYNDLILKNVLNLLGLPEDYQWIVYEAESIYIILKVFGNINSVIGTRFSRFSVISRRPYALPPEGSHISNYKTHFKYGIPKTALAQVTKETFYHCLEQMNTNDMVGTPLGEEKTRRMKILSIGCLGIFGVLIMVGFGLLSVLTSNKSIDFSMVIGLIVVSIICVIIAGFIMKD